MRFRVLEGSHISDGPRAHDGGRTDRVYHRGEVVESEVDLAKRFNSYAKDGSLISAKFERVWDDRPEATGHGPVPGKPGDSAGPAPVKPAGPPSAGEIAAMAMRDLQSLAAEHGVDLKGINGREAVVRVLTARLASVTPAQATAGAK